MRPEAEKTIIDGWLDKIDRMEIEAMSETELDQEIEAAGIDFAAFHQKIQQTLNNSLITRIADGIEQIFQGTGEFILSLTIDGMRGLQPAIAPTIMGGVNTDLHDKLVRHGVEMAITDIVDVDNGVLLVVHWLSGMPAQAPEVTISLRDAPLTTQVKWENWDGILDNAQAISVPCSLTATDLADLKEGARLVECQWSAESNRLEISLLPQ